MGQTKLCCGSVRGSRNGISSSWLTLLESKQDQKQYFATNRGRRFGGERDNLVFVFGKPEGHLPPKSLHGGTILAQNQFDVSESKTFCDFVANRPRNIAGTGSTRALENYTKDLENHLVKIDATGLQMV
jgi:hypothetical protein